LEYLKSKNVKTKKDKESIYMLEMILKNLKWLPLSICIGINWFIFIKY
jgi:hypothetical protein